MRRVVLASRAGREASLPASGAAFGQCDTAAPLDMASPAVGPAFGQPCVRPNRSSPTAQTPAPVSVPSTTPALVQTGPWPAAQSRAVNPPSTTRHRAPIIPPSASHLRAQCDPSPAALSQHAVSPSSPAPLALNATHALQCHCRALSARHRPRLARASISPPSTTPFSRSNRRMPRRAILSRHGQSPKRHPSALCPWPGLVYAPPATSPRRAAPPPRCATGSPGRAACRAFAHSIGRAPPGRHSCTGRAHRPARAR